MSANIGNDFIFAPPVVADASLPAVFTANTYGIEKAEYCRTNGVPLTIWFYGNNEASIPGEEYFWFSDSATTITINGGSPFYPLSTGSYSLVQNGSAVNPVMMWWGPGIYYSYVQRGAISFSATDLGSSPITSLVVSMGQMGSYAYTGVTITPVVLEIDLGTTSDPYAPYSDNYNQVWADITNAGGGTTSYTITPSAGTGGSISPSSPQSISSGGSQLFTASPDSGYIIYNWYVDSSFVQSGGSTYTISSVSADHTVRVDFRYTGSSRKRIIVVTCT